MHACVALYYASESPRLQPLKEFEEGEEVSHWVILGYIESIIVYRASNLNNVIDTGFLSSVMHGNHIAYDHHPRNHARPPPLTHTYIMKITQTRTFQ